MVSVSQVPTAAAMYYDDIYVERLLSEQTAALVGSEGGESTNFHAIARVKPQASHIVSQMDANFSMLLE